MEKSGNRRRFPAFALDFSRPVQETVARKGNCTDVPQVLEAFSQVLQVCFTFAINRILNADVLFLPQRLYCSWNMLQCIIHEGTYKNACLFEMLDFMHFMFILGRKCPYILVIGIYTHPQGKKQCNAAVCSLCRSL